MSESRLDCAFNAARTAIFRWSSSFVDIIPFITKSNLVSIFVSPIYYFDFFPVFGELHNVSVRKLVAMVTISVKYSKKG